MASETWDSAKAAAMKILGDKGKVPDLPDNISKSGDDLSKAWNEFDKGREDCESKLLTVQNTNDAVRNGLKQFDAKIQKEEFNLDSKNKDDLQKILKARKLLGGTIQTAVKNREADDKMLDEVDKHLIQLGKYKPPKQPSL
jgi:hypothetical protein